MNTSELRKYIQETLEEVSSEKQRRWACAQTGDDFKGEKELTDKEAKEMCSSPIEEIDRVRKSTGQYQDWRIKAKDMMWSYWDEELGSLDAVRKNSLDNKKSSDALIDKVFNVIVNTIPGEVPDRVKSVRKDSEEKRSLADMEKMGIHNLENPNIPVKVHTPLPDAGLKKKKSMMSRLGLRENTMKLTTVALKQMIKEELNLGMDQQGGRGAPEENVAIDNLTAAVDSLVQNLGYTIEEVLEIVQGLGESSGVSTLVGPDGDITTRDISEENEIEENCGCPDAHSEEEAAAPTRRYFKIR
jgi:hypothetical protein